MSILHAPQELPFPVGKHPLSPAEQHILMFPGIAKMNIRSAEICNWALNVWLLLATLGCALHMPYSFCHPSSLHCSVPSELICTHTVCHCCINHALLNTLWRCEVELVEIMQCFILPFTRSIECVMHPPLFPSLFPINTHFTEELCAVSFTGLSHFTAWIILYLKSCLSPVYVNISCSWNKTLECPCLCVQWKGLLSLSTWNVPL